MSSLLPAVFAMGPSIRILANAVVRGSSSEWHRKFEHTDLAAWTVGWTTESLNHFIA